MDHEPGAKVFSPPAENGEPCQPPHARESPQHNGSVGRSGRQLGEGSKSKRAFTRLFSHPFHVMCGRYRLTAKERYLRDHFGLDEDPEWTARWNIAPTQLVPIIRQDAAERSFRLVRWGLIPAWAKDRSIAAKTINAMSETAAERPAFRDALRLRRCLIPADGFYEWQSSGRQKLPFSIGMANDTVFAFAGLWEAWRDPNGGVIESCTILTTKPNVLVADVHTRMPAILKRDDYGAWLDPRVKHPAMITGFLKPFDAELMKKFSVSTRVNSPENDDQSCAQEVSTPTAQGTLF